MNEYLDLGLISSFVPAASSFAGDIDFLFDMITLIVGFFFILTLATLFYFLIRFPRKEGVKAQYITGEKHSETAFTVILAVHPGYREKMRKLPEI